MHKRIIAAAAVATFVCLLTAGALACTRFIYESATNNHIVGRSMDWAEDPGTDLWSFPKGMKRDGGAGPGSVEWTSKYGSVISSFYSFATVDGMNDAGLVANALYLVESDYGDADASGKPLISVGAWTQFALDNYGTVAEAVDALGQGAVRHRRARSARRQEGGRPSGARRQVGRQRDLRIHRRQARDPS